MKRSNRVWPKTHLRVMGLWICRTGASACQFDAGRPLRAPVQHPGDHAGREEALPDASLESFMLHCSSRIGEAYFRTPRNTVTAFVNMIAVLQQNPEIEWTDLIEKAWRSLKIVVKI
jgi:hypothetical protein